MSFVVDLSGDHRDLHSFPTRRSSDLAGSGLVVVSRLGVRMQDGGDADIADAAAGIHSRVGFDMRPGLLGGEVVTCAVDLDGGDRKSTRLNSSHVRISYAVFCLKKKKK